MLKNLIVVFLVLLISACTCTLDKEFTEQGALQAHFYNKNGEFVVIDKKSGKIIPPCSKRTGKDACRSPFDLSFLKKQVSTINGNPTKSNNCPLIKTNGKKGPQIVKCDILIHIKWVGSECDTFVDPISKLEYELCRPPLP